jgi:hypothetical protein
MCDHVTAVNTKWMFLLEPRGMAAHAGLLVDFPAFLAHQPTLNASCPTVRSSIHKTLPTRVLNLHKDAGRHTRGLLIWFGSIPAMILSQEESALWRILSQFR